MAKSTTEIIDLMMDKDAFSQWMGIERISETEGEVQLRMVVREDMLNGFGILHGGISYSLADSAFAFASNSCGRKSVSIETSISHLKKLFPGDLLLATAKKISSSHKTGLYGVNITNQNNDLVAVFKGTVYISSEEW